jgi:fido (protein-threonine AMPylation protein)
LFPSSPTPPPWPPHPADTAIIRKNIAVLDARIQTSKGHRDHFSLNLVRAWHQEMHQGCRHVPVPEYVGNFRGTAHPHLRAYQNRFAVFNGLPPADVPNAVAAVEADVTALLGRHDARMPNETSATPSRLNNVVEDIVGPFVEWIRIHPFVDGNGRTARLLINWVFARYWQPLLFPGRPPVDRDALIAATSPGLGVPPNYRAIRNHLRKRLIDARNNA